MARSVATCRGLVCALIVQLNSVSNAQSTANGSWLIEAASGASVHYQIAGNDEIVRSSHLMTPSDKPGVGHVLSSSHANQGGSSAVGMTSTHINTNFRTGLFSSISRAGVSVGSAPVTLGSYADFGVASVQWESDVAEELFLAYTFLSGNDRFDRTASIEAFGSANYEVTHGSGMLRTSISAPELHFANASAVAGPQEPADVTQFVVAWGVDGLPGTSVVDPFMPQVLETNGTFQFTIPVMQDYGIGNTLYFDPILATGYQYRVDGSRFASFTIPSALPGGDDFFQLEFEGSVYDIMAGEVFDFTSIDVLGASQFFLRGIDLSEMVDPNVNPPFVSGLSFTSEGIAHVRQIALTSVPEPDALYIVAVMLAAMFSASCLPRTDIGRSTQR